jgi:protein-disulfide isomerase
MKNPWVAIGVVVVVLLGGSVWYSMSVEKTYNVGITITDHITGGADAKVTLVEYSDFQCPACGEFEPVVEDIIKQYGDQLKFEAKNFPLIQIHPFAESAAVAAEAAAQQGKYFEFHNMLYAKQSEWTSGIAPGAYFSTYAKELGMDVTKFEQQQRSSLLKDKVKADYKAALVLGLTSTPTFFLNGKKMEISSIDAFKAQIAAAINPSANFGVNAGDSANKVVPVTDASGTASGTPSPTPTPVTGAPAVNFGI